MPGLSAGLPRIPDLPWESLSHRRVLAELAIERWVPMRGGATGRMRYALEIPYIARENSTVEIFALKRAWARAAR